MAYEMPTLVITLEAASDLSASQYLAVKVDSNGQAALAGAADYSVGVLQNKPDAQGKAAAIMVYGITRAIYGGSINPGDRVRADANGKMVAVSTSGPVLGIALESGSADEVHSVLLQAGGSFYSA